MRGAALFRERLSPLQKRELAVGSFVAVMACLLTLRDPAVGPPLLAMSIAGAVCAGLLLPQRSAIYRDRIALRESLWNRAIRGKRRWVATEDVLAVWPILYFQRSNHTRT